MFTEIKRLNVFDYSDSELISQIHTTCVEQGIPLVIEKYHLKQNWNAAIFTQNWLRDNYGQQEITARDMLTRTDEIMKLSEYLDFVEKAPIIEKTGEEKKRLYGKDIICPQGWKDAIDEFLPNYFTYHDVNDLMDNLMIYVGFGGTKTPLHKDMCASFGHNIMVSADPGAFSTWYMVRSEDADKMQSLLKTINQDIDLECYTATPEFLSTADFTVYKTDQHIGDLVLVPSESCHEVINEGCCTIKISWNRVTPYSIKSALETGLPNYHRVLRPETYNIKRIIYYSIIKWTIGFGLVNVNDFKKMKFEGSDSGTLKKYIDTICSQPGRDIKAEYKTLILSFKKLIEEEWVNAEAWDDRKKLMKLTNNHESGLVCDYCHCNIWNRHYHCYSCQTEDETYFDLCLQCYASGRGCQHFMYLRRHLKMRHILKVYKSARDTYYKKFDQDPLLPSTIELEGSSHHVTSKYKETEPTHYFTSEVLSEISTALKVKCEHFWVI
ncbi:5510_t:CDS:2 [Entrophospora sp. SA101]|nr:5510_t:CDS:2 [Entrophospora sp. SA101]